MALACGPGRHLLGKTSAAETGSLPGSSSMAPALALVLAAVPAPFFFLLLSRGDAGSTGNDLAGREEEANL